MSDESFEQDVLNELGDDKLQEIAGLLGPDADADSARTFVGDTVSALSGGLQDKAAGAPEDADEVKQAVDEVGQAASGDAPLQGVAAFAGGGGLGGLLGGGLMTGVLAKLSRPVAQAVSKRTGIPVATVSRGIELLIPVILAVMTKRAAGAKSGSGAGAPGSSPADSGGSAPGAAPAQGQKQGGGLDLGELLGQILGGKK